MTDRKSKEQMDDRNRDSLEEAKKTHSGMPGPVDPDAIPSSEHKSGYGGEGGEPRTSSDTRQPKRGKPA